MKIPEVPGIAVLLIGIALLVATFIDAYLLLTEDINILPVPNLTAALGEALAPLIEAAIRMIYIAIMIWIGSTITMRGITILLQVKPETKPKTPEPQKILKEPKETKTKAEPEPKNIEEAWEKALQEAKLEVKSA